MKDRYRVELNANIPINAARKGLDIFAKANEDEADIYQGEVNNFFDVTQRPDRTCKDVTPWWRLTVKHSFSNIAKLAGDTLMVMGPERTFRACLL